MANYLFASLVWGSLGVAMIVYAKKQAAILPFLGGLAILLASYFAPSAMTMSLICVFVMLAMYVLHRMGM